LSTEQARSLRQVADQIMMALFADLGETNIFGVTPADLIRGTAEALFLTPEMGGMGETETLLLEDLAKELLDTADSLCNPESMATVIWVTRYLRRLARAYDDTNRIVRIEAHD
jgi:hypothetical protein